MSSQYLRDETKEPIPWEFVSNAVQSFRPSNSLHHALPMFRSRPISPLIKTPSAKKRRVCLTDFQRFSFFARSAAREPILCGDPGTGRRYLSNFQMLPDGVTVSLKEIAASMSTDDYSEYDLMEFKSIEHAFQAAKYAFASMTEGCGVKAWKGALELSDVEDSCPTALLAKKKGGRIQKGRMFS